MPTITKQIHSFTCSASLTHDSARIDLIFSDGSKQIVDQLTPSKFTAALAVLQATPNAYYSFDQFSQQHSLSSSADTPDSAP